MVHRFALMGCGGMGRRHLQGFGELARARPGLVELVAVIDVAADRAEFAAGEAADLLGSRPGAFTSLDQAVRAVPDLEAVDVVTTASTHHAAAEAALDHGLHVLVEKPMAVTVRGCGRMRQAVTRNRRVLSVAENYRRDPISRLARALLQAGAIGECRTVLETQARGGDRMIITPWRHLREEGGPLLDVGVHFADMLLYLLGPVTRVFGLARLLEPEREATAPSGDISPFYERFRAQSPHRVRATAPDSLVATLSFESGVVGQWMLETAAHGPGSAARAILGSQGWLEMAQARTGTPLTLRRGGAADPLPDEELLGLVPDFGLDDLTAELFGGARLPRYQLDFPEIDRKLIAVEIAELAQAIGSGRAVEVGPAEGQAAVEVVLAALESSQAGRPVGVDEIRGGTVSAYQDPIDRKLGLLD